MSTGAIVAIVVVVIVVAALVAVAAFAARRRRLQRTFGPEYDRAVESSDSRRKAEAELAEREKRVKHLDIRPLDPAARDGYAAQWTEIQQQFVDSPATAVTGAQTLITNVMREEGYPTENADQIMADLSVEHAATLEHFRTAQDLSSRVSGGTAGTEDLRQAMVHYRELFRELLGSPADVPADEAAAGQTAAGQTAAGQTAAGQTAAGTAATTPAYDADAPAHDAEAAKPSTEAPTSERADGVTAAYDAPVTPTTPDTTTSADASPAAADDTTAGPAGPADGTAAVEADDEADDEATPARTGLFGRRR